MELENAIIEVMLDDIIPNRFQPRLSFDEKAMNELAESIKQHGIIQPLVLRKLGDKYEIIAGERRYKAAGIAGLTKIPAVIANIDDNASAEVALVENIQRKNLTAIEEAKSYKSLLDKGYLTQEQLAKRIGVSQSAISNKLRLLNLAPEVQDALLGEKISERHARALLQIEDKEDQKKWLDRIIRERMTVRTLDTELKKLKDAESESAGDVPLVSLTPNLDEIKANAEDLHPEPEPKIVEDFFPAPANENIVISAEDDVKPPEVALQDQIPRKFFNFLEDEQANLSMDKVEMPSVPKPEPAPSIEIIDAPMPEPTNESVISPFEQPTMDFLSPTPSIDAQPVIEPMETPMPIYNEQPVSAPIMPSIELPKPAEDTIETLTVDNIQSLEGPAVEVQETIYEQPNPTINPIVYDQIPVVEDVVDPVSMFDKLDPEYEKKMAEAMGTDLKTGINLVRENVKSLENRGFRIDVDEMDFDDSYNIIIKIIK